ncbi:hypothetical protein [Flavihumibacter sp. UBA7668]|uniref:hypothetical protein n=1 Tax=Flavihumibacter sp. UBA7668 TaxID=1946542 RepID=UPI0025C63501|nr:hypothetical protein [Flavihumibacter sp. UBA7668]
MKKQNELRNAPAITNLAELRARSRDLAASIRSQEIAIREHAKSLPSESLKAGVGRLFSGKTGTVLAGPIAGLAMSAGSALLGSFLTKKATTAVAGKLGMNLAKTALVALVPVLLKLFKRK